MTGKLWGKSNWDIRIKWAAIASEDGSRKCNKISKEMIWELGGASVQNEVKSRQQKCKTILFWYDESCHATVKPDYVRDTGLTDTSI